MLVGRESEQRLLERLVSGARVGASGVLVITGEPGVGKSTLLDHVEDLAVGMTVLRAVGSATEREISFGVLHQLLHPAAPALDRIPARQAEALGVALALREGRIADRLTVGVATLGLISRLAEDRPLALLVDDAQWLDAASADALSFAARRLVADPIVLVAATRDTVDADLARRGLPRLALSGLDRATTRELLDHRYGEHLTDEVVDRLQRTTGGNPLALLELADSGRTEASSPTAPIPLSDSLAEGFAGRAAQLSDRERRALLIAATEGGRLAVVLQALSSCGGAPEDLVGAERAGLVSVVTDRIEFRHPLVRSAVYAQASPAGRRDAHGAVADAIGDLGSDSAGARDRLAWHRAEATLGPDRDVAAALDAVAARATARGAHDAAASALERAARHSSTESEAAPRFLEAAAAALLAGRARRATGLLDAAATQTFDRPERVRFLALRGAVAAHTGAMRESRDLLLSAADLLGGAEDHPRPAAGIPLLVDALYANFCLGDGRGASDVARRLEQLLPLTSAGDLRDLGTLAVGIAGVLAGEGGTRQIRAALDSLTVSGALEKDPQHLGWLILGPLWLRESRAGRDLVEQVAEDVRDRAAVATLPFLLFLLGRDDATTDRWAEAQASYTEAELLARETGRVPDLVAALAGLAWLEARQGREVDCRAHAAEALRECLPRHLDLFRVWALFALGELELGLGRPADALGHLEELQAVLRSSGLADADLSPVPELAEVRLRLGRVDRIGGDPARFLAEAEAKGQPWALARAHRAMALVSTGDEAERQFVLAREHHARTLDAFESARTALAFGAWLRRDRHRRRARSLLGEALETFERLGALPWAEIAATELAATGQTVHRRAAGTLDELTPQQLQIAQLLASGRTTREAAAALFVSRKTIEYHLRNVYLKLGISSREELAAAMRR